MGHVARKENYRYISLNIFKLKNLKVKKLPGRVGIEGKLLTEIKALFYFSN